MATPENTAPSRRLRSAAGAERQRLRRRLEKVERQIARLRGDLLAAEQRAAMIRKQVALLGQLTYEDGTSAFPEQRRLRPVPELAEEIPAPSTPTLGYLRGAEIRVAAVRVLAAAE